MLGLPLSCGERSRRLDTRGSNRTSAALRSQLLDSTQLQIAHQTIKDFTLKFDGPLFDLPGGAVRAAVGGEYIEYTMREEVSRERGTGPASTNSLTTFLDLGRDVKSGFVELLVPIVGEGNSFPGVRGLDVNVSGRYDDYSDFGDTTNPKYAINWTIVDGVRMRANYAESFTAPALTSRGNVDGVTAESSFGGLARRDGVRREREPRDPEHLPGRDRSAGLHGGDADVSHQHLERAGRVPRGRQQGSRRAGRRDVLRRHRHRAGGATGLAVQRDVVEHEVPRRDHGAASRVRDRLAGSQQPAAAVPGRRARDVLAAATRGLPQTSPLAATSYFIYSFQQRNAFNLDANGIDADLSYRFQTDIGNFAMGSRCRAS